MGGCFSKKKEEEKDDPSSSPRARGGGRQGQKTAAVSSRDPPPTESPQEEKVKEVLSETPKITRQKSNKYSDRGNRDATVDRSQVREEFSAASTTLTEATATTITRAAAAAAAAAEDDEEGEIEMRPAVTRSRSSANFQKKIYNRSDFNVKDAHRPAAAGKREIRGVDVGCRSARSSPSPAMEEGNAVTRNRVSSAAAAAAAAAAGHNNKNSNYYKRSSDRGERWLSPATKGSIVPAMNQRRQCRANPNLSATASTTTTTRANINGRFSPQKVRPPPPARVLHFEEARRGQDGNNAGSAAAAAEDGNALEAKESLENPLVSMECFIFL